MPKRTYKILRFDGGINDDADPRDIADNQFVKLENIAVGEVGKLVALGNIRTQHITITGVLTGQGNGLFAVSTDHTGFLTGSVASPGQTYYLVENGDYINGIGIDDEETAQIPCTLGDAGVTMYYVDGALRIGDADHGGGDAPQWRGFIKGKLYGTDLSATHANYWGHVYNSGRASDDRWYTQNATITGCFPEVNFTDDDMVHTVGHNLILSNHWDSDGGGTGFRGPCFAGEESELGNGPTDNTSGDSDNMFWGLGLQINEEANGTGTWMPTTSIRYQFYASTVYDDNQESLPQLFTMYGSNNLHTNDDYIGSTPTGDMYFTNANTYDEVGKNVAVTFSPIVKLNGADWEDDGSDGGIAGDMFQGYNFGASTVTAQIGGNPRITGVNIYWASNEDGYTSKWLLIEWDFVKGVRPIAPEGGNIGAGGYNQPDSTSQEIADDEDLWYLHVHGSGNPHGLGFKWIDPPKIFLYDDIVGHSPDEVIKVDSFKTAVVTNRRVYLGNIEQNGQIHEDRVLVSPVNQFDKFPESMALDIVAEDGDEIVLLLEYADRILQFKKNILYILNISEDVEFLEAEYKFKGITNPGAACKTDYGIAWANQHGCYMYDGRQVIDLLEDKGMRKINISTWSAFISDENYHRIGFNPFKRQLIILNGISSSAANDDAYVYDMVTKSWTFSTNMISDGDTGSNFINDPVDGKLLIFDDATNVLDTWADTPTSNPYWDVITKDIDFGEPAVRKKIYKVYITYRSDSYTVPAVGYGVDGSSTPGTVATTVTAFTDTSNQWTRAEYKFGSDANNCKSIQLRITQTAHTSFEINDITFIYRMKSIK